eukprot:CAMPEP_0118920936 /NCGR_PEP_ID=MMETSP1169-20130426/354_1 /TAXON_ID=36882 /ORGANISM="Pyramimonas obovata, Strain CCMP722" /LENGTH=279 /DNA_ID=CAMNT_0006861559 /DNA_START=238 /DNA_END=1077 /DNA_ORIENTATION=-
MRRSSVGHTYEKKASCLSAKAYHTHNTGLRLKAPRGRSATIGLRTTATLDERARSFDGTSELREECHGICCINKGPFGERRVPIYDNEQQKMVWADITGRMTPDHVGFSGSASQLWTLDMRLVSNGVKIGDIVVRVSPSADWDKVDLTVCSILSWNRGRFQGVGTALVSHMVHGDWLHGERLQVRSIVADNVHSSTAYFWYTLGFRFSQGAEEEDYYVSPGELDRELEAIIGECEECIVFPAGEDAGCLEEYEDVKRCVADGSYRLTGGGHEMTCKLEC